MGRILIYNRFLFLTVILLAGSEIPFSISVFKILFSNNSYHFQPYIDHQKYKKVF